MPNTPFIGVLISWLIAAKNKLLERFAASAASLLFCNSISACLRSEISLNTANVNRSPSHSILDSCSSPKCGWPSKSLNLKEVLFFISARSGTHKLLPIIVLEEGAL